MPQRTIDNTVVTGAISAPFWVPALEQINLILTAVSLALGILYLLWRWRKQAKSGVAE